MRSGNLTNLDSGAAPSPMPGTVLFQAKFECSPEFVKAFDAAAAQQNRSRTGQTKQLCEDFAGMKAMNFRIGGADE